MFLLAAASTAHTITHFLAQIPKVVHMFTTLCSVDLIVPVYQCVIVNFPVSQMNQVALDFVVTF